MSYRDLMRTLAVVVTAMCTMLSACTDQYETLPDIGNGDNVSIPMPRSIAEARLTLGELRLSVIVNGIELSSELTAIESLPWTGAISVPIGQPIQFSVLWSATGIDLAVMERVLPAMTSDQSVSFQQSDYVYPDDDGNGVSNLDELKNSDDMMDPVEPMECPDDGPPIPYRIPCMGPAGGLVFFLSDDGLSGLEAAPVDQSFGANWNCGIEGFSGANGAAISTGKQNTEEMLNFCARDNSAAFIVDDYTTNNFSDWFLPSQDELREIYNHLFNGGASSFFSENYWSSTRSLRDSDGPMALTLNFANGQPEEHRSSELFKIRAIRAFP